MIHIRTFRAPDDLDACEKFIVEHKKLLEIYGFTKVTSNKVEWIEDYNTIVIVVEDAETKKLYGGARLQIATETNPLPIETALVKFDRRIVEIIKQGRQNGGTAEICGLWNSREVAGMGIGSNILGRVAVAVSSQLNINSLFLLCAPITTRMGKRVGAVVEESLGNKGLFYYPKEDFIATAMSIKDIYDLATATDYEKDKIALLRQNPHQVMEEIGPKGNFSVDYDLKIPNL